MTSDEFLGALEFYLECKKDHDYAREQYEGHSWDYHGRAFILRVEDAREKFRKVVEELMK